MEFKHFIVGVTIIVSILLITGCGSAEQRTLATCKKLESVWGSQMAKRRELLRDLGVTAGKEAMVVYRMKQHGAVHKEKRSKACVHIITDYQH